MRIGFLVSHPIQYYAPIFRELAKRCDLTVYFAHRQTPEQQGRAGFGVSFEWDVDLLSGYEHRFLTNVAAQPSTDSFWGCDTPSIRREIAAGAYDAFIVPGWALKSYWQAVWACRRAGVPVLVRGDSQLGRRFSPLARAAKAMSFSGLLRAFDGYLYVGQRNREYLLHYGAPPDRLFFSPHCVDNDWFRAGSHKARKARSTPPSNIRRVLFVGKLINRKRPLDTLEAAIRMRSAGMPVQIAFAGAGELQDELERRARQSGLSAEFLGFVNQSSMPAVYASADVVVLPSDISETWGLVINEAMACGVPAVVSDGVGCGPDLIQEGATGSVFPLGNVPALADSLRSVFAFNKESCRAGLAARIGRYSPEHTAKGIVEGADGLCRRRLQK